MLICGQDEEHPDSSRWCIGVTAVQRGGQSPESKVEMAGGRERGGTGVCSTGNGYTCSWAWSTQHLPLAQPASQYQRVCVRCV